MSEPPLPSARRQVLFAKYRPLLTTPFLFGFSTHVLSPTLFSRFGYFIGKKRDLIVFLLIDFSALVLIHL
jgi:hypothetical protein